MDDTLKDTGDEGLFALVPSVPLTFDPHAEARRQDRLRKEAADREYMEARIKSLPTREELAVRAVDIFETHMLPDTKLKAMQFYAQLMGFMDKDGKGKKAAEPEAGAKVMAVPLAASAADWESKATSYMKKLERMANG